MTYALLTDEAGSVLLVRKRGSLLWSLPGGDSRSATSWRELLTTYCLRQLGVAPDVFGAAQPLSFAGVQCVVATGCVVRARAIARGRLEAISWVDGNAMPTDTDPIARMAAGTLLQIKTDRVAGPQTSTV